MAHGVFDRRPESPEEDHVADDVHPAGVHEHRGEQRDAVMAVDDAERDGGPGAHEAVAAGELLKNTKTLTR